MLEWTLHTSLTVQPEYEHKTKPFAHQAEVFEQSRDLSSYALWWEQGTGKTKPMVDTAAWLFESGRVNGVLVLAPNLVHENWLPEIDRHMPTNTRAKTRVLVYRTFEARRKSYPKTLASFSKHGGLAVLVMSYDGIMTEKGKKVAKKFLTSRACLYIADEVNRIKNPNAKTTKRVLASAKYPPYRRALTGTPIANAPFDIFAPVIFLKGRAFWRKHGVGSFASFKSYYGVWVQQYNKDQDQEFKRCVDYKNLHELHEIFKQVGSRITKDVALPDLPPKLYSRRCFDFTPKQTKIYDRLKEEFIAEIESGVETTAVFPTVRLLRFAQIASGYVPVDDGPTVDIDKKNPRLELLKQVVEDIPHRAIIWIRFRRDGDLICDALRGRVARCDGTVPQSQRQAELDKFLSGECQFLVANPAALREGVTLHCEGECRTAIYYNNDFNLVNRLQSEDRIHRIGQPHSVHIIDIVAKTRPVDRAVLDKLLKKRNIAAEVTGDNLLDWV